MAMSWLWSGKSDMTTRTVCAIAVVVLAACAGKPQASTKGAHDAAVTSGLAQLRTATQSFHDLDAAVKAGYPREVENCLIHEHHGAMGYHHVNRSLLDAHVDIEHPEILLYERIADGKYKLNGVEFIVPFRAWPRDSSATPTVMGQPMKKEDNLKFWYRHVWVWSDNSDGVFADFNPAVSCPADNRKVYTPTMQ